MQRQVDLLKGMVKAREGDRKAKAVDVERLKHQLDREKLQRNGTVPSPPQRLLAADEHHTIAPSPPFDSDPLAREPGHPRT